MGHLLYSAKDSRGEAVQGFVEAKSALEARQQLAARGLADIVLHQEATIATEAGEVAGLGQAQLRELARIRIALMQRPGLWPVLLEVARANRWWILADVAIIAGGLWSDSGWLVATGAFLALLPFGVSLWSYRHSGRYTALLRSFALGKWDHVEQLASKLRPVSAKVAQMDFELDVRLAGIQARKGDLAGALARLEGWRPKLAGTPGLYESRVAVVYAAGEDRVGFVQLMDQAHELSGREPARALDLALAHARFGDAAAAAGLLQGVDAKLLPPHALGFVAWVDGLVRLRLGQPEALARLGEATAAFLALAGQPAAWTALAFCTCDHAVALAMAGRKGEARAELAHVWPIVKAHADRPLLRMLEADGLLPY